MEEYHFENIYGGALAVSKNHSFSADPLYLADFAHPKKNEKVLDLCTGCGIIPAIWLTKGLVERVSALDISEEAMELLTLTIEKNAWSERLSFILADLKNKAIQNEAYNLVTANPPYFEESAGRIKKNETEGANRSETLCTLKDVIYAAKRALIFGGRFCMCHRPERLADIISELRMAGLEPKRLEFISHKGESTPWLILIEAKKGRGKGLTVSFREE